MSKRFDIYTKNGCGWCEQAKQLLQRKGYTYNEKVVGVNATKDEIQQRVKSLGLGIEIKTVPQIFLLTEKGLDTYVGGFDELNRQVTGGQL
jgi:glutaredoxin